MTDDTRPPEAAPPGRSIGKDQWVESAAERRVETGVDKIRRRITSTPVQWRILVVGVAALLFALVSPTDYITRIAFTVALYTLLATGLNVVVGWAGLLAPAGTPKPIIDKLYAGMAKALAMPDVKDAILRQGSRAVSSKSPEDFARYIKAEMDKFHPVIKAAGLEGSQ